MKPYEAIVIFKSTTATEKIDAAVAKFEKKIRDSGGTDIATSKWGIKKLAYPIKKAKNDTEGYYVLIDFNGEGNTPNELKASLNITEEVIRYFVVNAKPAAKEAKEENVEIEPSMILPQNMTSRPNDTAGEQGEIPA